MKNLLSRSWYKKKRYVLSASGLIALSIMFGSFSTPVHATTKKVVYYTAHYPVLSNNHYYTNTKGNSVHAPAYAPAIPANASAQCGDGTFSFSQSHRGACSHHGGVAEWL